jgi:hypothetical protein
MKRSTPDNPARTDLESAVADRAEWRAWATLDETRQARWDRLGMTKQRALMAEWDRDNPPRPGEHPRLRVMTRLAWCLETLERREKAGGVP